MDRTFAIRKVINYFNSFLALTFLWPTPFWVKAPLPKLNGREELDLYKLTHPTEEELLAKKRKNRVETIQMLGIPFIIGTLVGFVAMLITHSYIPYIIVSSIPFFGVCLLIAAYVDGDIDYNIPMSFPNFILSLIWGIGGAIGIVVGSLIFH